MVISQIEVAGCSGSVAGRYWLTKPLLGLGKDCKLYKDCIHVLWSVWEPLTCITIVSVRFSRDYQHVLKERAVRDQRKFTVQVLFLFLANRPGLLLCSFLTKSWWLFRQTQFRQTFHFVTESICSTESLNRLSFVRLFTLSLSRSALVSKQTQFRQTFHFVIWVRVSAH